MALMKKLFDDLSAHAGERQRSNYDLKTDLAVRSSSVKQRYPERTKRCDIFDSLLAHVRNGRFVIPEGMLQIPDGLFDGHGYMQVNGKLVSKSVKVSQIISLFIPGTVKRIGERSFADCENLEEVTLFNGVEVIEDNAFTGCKKLKTIRLPSSVKKVSGWTFFDSGLTVPVFTADGKMLVYYPQTSAASEYVVPEGVEEIGSRAFIDAKQLTKVVLPQTLKRIQTMAFIESGFKTITIPKNTVIENNAFAFFKHRIRIIQENERDALDEKMEYSRISGIPFLNRQRMKPPQEQYWKQDAFQTLAQFCAIGDVAAMDRMGDYFLGKAEQDEGNAFFQCAAQFWRTRAYRYGSETSKQYLTEWSEANPNACMASPGINEKLSGAADGNLLNALGFLFFKEDRTYSLSGIDAQGVVEVYSWESDEGPDADGYGREAYYDWWYLNEYLLLPDGAGYIHGFSHNDKRCNEMKFRVLHDQVAEMNKK